ncbi:unnamed protein product [Lepeophtheirus salmonis]|uniref:(salmon louse) hypothetical protein n=1 Tax=Lepeophtheirus salmonis TaxID=72036 RepID=A0A7R8H989_LEPSM|nr:unnamed protein product [Lepeophtheirus salmonis]CAF2945036.1 unnamed protein product [Lepeophtheirus salmonis]
MKNNPWTLPFILISCSKSRGTTYFRHCNSPAKLKRTRDLILFPRRVTIQFSRFTNALFEASYCAKVSLWAKSILSIVQCSFCKLDLISEEDNSQCNLSILSLFDVIDNHTLESHKDFLRNISRGSLIEPSEELFIIQISNPRNLFGESFI